VHFLRLAGPGVYTQYMRTPASRKNVQMARYRKPPPITLTLYEDLHYRPPTYSQGGVEVPTGGDQASLKARERPSMWRGSADPV